LFASPPIAATGSPLDIGFVTYNPFSPNAGPHHMSMSNVDELGVIILEQPDSLYYTWPAQSVSGLKVDNIKVTFMHDILGSKLIPAITATDTVSFTLNDIEGVSATCCNHDGIRGDANLDNAILVDDLVLLVDFLFKGGPPPDCYEEGDANGSGIILVDDLTLLVDYLFKGGPPPVACP